ncbi:tRNA epoxyqueuosine(34) reductase QueG, partial [Patescibacteria group bacterium]|nr:tRNA epoxyqueuosine(34) reductase QueG [Patescibacteria group bacterium]
RGVIASEAKQSPLTQKSKARFARGQDYHEVVREKLEELWNNIKQHALEARAKFCVDTSPILEKALAARAGIGWIGKHTILLNEKIGSWFVLGEIITDLEIESDEPAKDLCADCDLCINACPTNALKASRTLDANLCVSYLTIEHKGEVPSHMRKHVSQDTYGCDLCQQACPYNVNK